MNAPMNAIDKTYGTSPAPQTVRLERLLPATPERVWTYLTDPEKRATWFAGGPIEPRVGGKAQLLFKHSNFTDETPPEQYKEASNCDRHGTVLKWDPPHVLAYTWGESSQVEFELTPRGEKTLLVITHSKLPNRSHMLGVSGGWHAHVDILEDRLNGVMTPRPFWSNHARLKGEYDKRLPQE